MKRHALPIAVIGAIMFSLLPVLWILLTSLKSPEQIGLKPPVWIPALSTQFYEIVFKKHHFFRYMKNSLIVAGTTTVLSISIAMIAAYAFAKIQFRFRNGLLLLLLGISMFPQMAMVGGIYRILFRWGLLNSYAGLILPYTALALPMAIWILTSFFKEIPVELEEAARVDGCGPFTTLWKIFFPVALPAVFTTAILVFIYAWNEFFFALLIMTNPDVQTVPVGIAMFPGEYEIPWGELSAAAIVATLPLILLVLFMQKRIVSGLTAGAVKG